MVVEVALFPCFSDLTLPVITQTLLHTQILHNSNLQHLWIGRPFSYPWFACRVFLSDLKAGWLGSMIQWHCFFIFSKQKAVKKIPRNEGFCNFIEKTVLKKKKKLNFVDYKVMKFYFWSDNWSEISCGWLLQSNIFVLRHFSEKSAIIKLTLVITEPPNITGTLTVWT